METARSNRRQGVFLGLGLALLLLAGGCAVQDGASPPAKGTGCLGLLRMIS